MLIMQNEKLGGTISLPQKIGRRGFVRFFLNLMSGSWFSPKIAIADTAAAVSFCGMVILKPHYAHNVSPISWQGDVIRNRWKQNSYTNPYQITQNNSL